MKIVKLISIVVFILLATLIQAQDESSNYLRKRWKEVATKMPSEWYGSDEAKLVAENILIYQKDAGGWEKNKNLHREISDSTKEDIIKGKSKIGATFDNGATITELRFLAKVHSNFKETRYKEAFLNGLDYIFNSQYKNGGWPQFFPYRGNYSNHITYNDNAMVNTMNFLKEIIADNKEYASLQIDSNRIIKAKSAFEKGIQCILNTQIIVNGKPTVWCAQHDEKTLAPANARSYELASFSGAESVGIVELLMDIENPSKEVIEAVNGAIYWFDNHRIKGIKIEKEIDAEGKKNRIVVEDPSAPDLWARFYDLETGNPYFCSRDGIKKNSLAEISHNRRNGYSWYTNAPAEILQKYPEWKNKIN